MMNPSSSIVLKPPPSERYLAKTEKSGSLSPGMILPRLGISAPPRAGGCLLDGLLELAALDQVVGEPGRFVGAHVAQPAGLFGILLGDALERGAVGQGRVSGPKHLFEQRRVAGQEQGVLGDRDADRAAAGLAGRRRA